MKNKYLRWFFISLFVLVNVLSKAQNKAKFKGDFYDKENKIALHLDLENATVEAPSYDFLGKINGYMDGNIYGMWFITKHTLAKNKQKAIIELSSDLGAESQSMELVWKNDSIFSCTLIGKQVIKKIEQNKLVKIPITLYFQ